MSQAKKKASDKQLAGHTMHRMTLATVQRLWERIGETHNVCGALGPGGREIAVAVPRSDSQTQGWVGYSMDGTTWYGAHVKRGVEGARLMAAAVREVTQ